MWGAVGGTFLSSLNLFSCELAVQEYFCAVYQPVGILFSHFFSEAYQSQTIFRPLNIVLL